LIAMPLEVLLATAQPDLTDPISQFSHEIGHPLEVIAVARIVFLNVRGQRVHWA
jgi:hypothetical protein